MVNVKLNIDCRNFQGNVFTHVCHSIHRGVAGRHSPGQTPPPRQTPPPWADTPQADTSSWADTPWAWADPPQVTATAVDGTHPTGMHSCSLI